MKNKTQNIKTIKSIVASLLLLVIILSAAYAYYTASKKARKYNLNIESGNIALIYETSANVQANFDAYDLTQESNETEPGYYGYLESDPVSSILSLSVGDDENYATCKYEIWYEPTNVWESSSSGKSMVLVGRSTSEDASAMNGFEFDITGLSEKTKIMDAYITANSGIQTWDYSLRLYNSVEPETDFDLSVSGIISLKSLGCGTASLVADEHNIVSKTNKNTQVKIQADSSNIDVTVSNEDIVDVSMDGSYLKVSRKAGGDAVIYLTDNNGGYDSINVDADVSITFNDLMLANKGTLATQNISCDNSGLLTYDIAGNNYHLDLSGRTSLDSKTNCRIKYLTYANNTSRYASTYVKNLANTTATSTTWKVSDSKGYRYQGANPDNYVLFNNELWRIIGVFDSNFHGIEDKQLVKIIRDEPIGSYSYVTSITRDVKYENSLLYPILNDYYYNAIDGTSSGNCKSTYDNIPVACDFRSIGISDSYYRNMIAESSVYQTRTLKEEDYLNTDELTASSLNSSAYIQTLNLTDYNLAAIRNDTCTSDLILNYDSTYNGLDYKTKCDSGNWLFTGAKQFLSTYDKYGYTMTIFDYFNYWSSVDNTNVAYNVKPTLYLKDDVSIVSGNGTKTNPYILSR